MGSRYPHERTYLSRERVGHAYIAPADVVFSPRRGVQPDVFVVPPPRRGFVPIGPVRTVRADPIGLLRREVVWAESLDLFVHPRGVCGATCEGALGSISWRCATPI